MKTLDSQAQEVVDAINKSRFVQFEIVISRSMSGYDLTDGGRGDTLVRDVKAPNLMSVLTGMLALIQKMDFYERSERQQRGNKTRARNRRQAIQERREAKKDDQ